MRPPTPYSPPPAHSLETVFADDTIIVADKPSGLLSVPGRGPEKAICAVSLLEERHGTALTVHRLDMDTSGLLIFACNKDAQRHLSMQFERRAVSKTYEAVVEGETEEDSGTIDAAIAKHSNQRPLRHLDPDGQTAITHWRVIDRAAAQTRLELTPETGRSHQLRLHMASIGHPILGDVFYGDEASADRLNLHAKTIGFKHPNSLSMLTFSTATPF